MINPEPNPDLKHLVLLGGGHAQVSVLKSLIMRPVPGLRVTLISRDILTPYSGMLPGYLEGVYTEDEITIDLSHLARLAGARFIHGTVEKLDPDHKTLTIKGYPAISYDLLSINIGSSPGLHMIKGGDQFAIPVKPISQLLNKINPILHNIDNKQINIGIIGAGAAGVEMALSLHHRLVQQDKRQVSFHLFQRSTEIMPEFPSAARRYVTQELNAKKISLHTGVAVEEINPSSIKLSDGNQVEIDHALVVTAGRPAPFIQDSSLDLDDRGFIAVNNGLRSTSHTDVFAAGDIATVLDAPCPKAGVFAVRAGPILTENLRNALLSKPLTEWTPQKNYLALIGTGDQKALAIRGNIVLPPSRLLWHLKELIDRKFIQKFSVFPKMNDPQPHPLAQVMIDQGHRGEAALASMRCLGCGAKTGFSDLEKGIAEAETFLKQQGIDLKRIDTRGDSAVFTLPEGKIVQSVDAISAIVDDPFMLGRIAALHALSDLIASHAKPHSALAILTLPHAFSRLQKTDITLILAGAMKAFHEHGAVLAGGHTSSGPALQVGFAVTGIAQESSIYEPKDGDAVILTKPLGIGAIMAGHGQGHDLATGQVRQKAIDVMAQSNAIAGDILAKFGYFPMTDITGFGLARHGLSLLSSLGAGTASFEIEMNALPIISPAAEILKDHQSSLHHANALAAPVHGHHDRIPTEILYDPQTGGGLLAVIPNAQAHQIINQLNSAGLDAAIIGSISMDNRAEFRIS